MTAPSWNVAHQDAAAEALRAGVAGDGLAHAFLLVGPPGVGQRELARALAAALNCQNARDGAPCGHCSTCDRIGRDAHSALVSFEPEGRHHLVKDVRDGWVHTASRTLSEGRRRVIRIVGADRMNEAAQNAFLKSLEEPPPSTVWVLEAEDHRALLDTIVSRCQRLDLTTWSPAALAALAADLSVAEELRPALVRAAMGSPDRLAALASRECPVCGRVYVVGGDGHVAAQCLHHEITCTRCGKELKGPVKVDLRRRTPCDCAVDEFEIGALRGVATEPETARGRHLGVVERFAREGPGAVSLVVREVTAWAEETMSGLGEEQEREWESLADAYGAERPADLPSAVRRQVERRHKRQQRQAKGRAIERFLDDLGSYLRDLLVVHAGGDDVVNLDHLDRLREDAGRLTPAAAIRGLDDIARCRQALDEFNGQPELQLERVLTPMAASIYAATVAA